MNSENLVYYLICSHSIPGKESISKKREIRETGDARSFLSSHSLSGSELQLGFPDYWLDTNPPPTAPSRRQGLGSQLEVSVNWEEAEASEVPRMQSQKPQLPPIV